MTCLVVQSASVARQVRAQRRAFFSVTFMRKHRLETGDVIWIHAKNKETKALGIAWPSFSIQQEKEIQLGSLLRLNARLRLGDQVSVEKVKEVREAKHIYVVSSVNLRPSTGFELYLKEHLFQLGMVTVKEEIELLYHGRIHQFILERIDDQVEQQTFAYQVTSTTTVHFKTETVEKPLSRIPTNVGGLDHEMHIVRELIQVPLKQPQLYTQYGLKPPRGVLLYGPPGTGKTLIARTLAREMDVYLICINGPEVMSKFYGETEAKLRDIFNEAKEHAPSIIFIDEIDALCPKREETVSDMDKLVVATLLTLMDGVEDGDTWSRVVVLAATNRPNVLDDALRRPGRFDREVEIGIPNAEARASILKAQLENTPHTATEKEIELLASITHGYVGADLAAVCREAGLKAIQRAVQHHSDQVAISFEELRQAVAETRPSAMREIAIEVPKVYWDDIGGQEEIKQKLQESIAWPLKHADAFIRLGIRPPKGILLYGPPGCSKTLMAKALATESGLNFIAVKGPELFSKWVGESEKAVRDLFRRARAASPSIIFFDEIDALTMKRGSDTDSGASVADRVLAQLLNELDGIEPLVNVTVVAATNRPDMIDAALLRPGRIDRMLYVGPPDVATREAIFRVQLKRMPCANDVNITELCQWTEGCSGAEVVALCQEAALAAMEEDIEATEVCRRHFLYASKHLVRRIRPEMIEFYDTFRKQSGLRDL